MTIPTRLPGLIATALFALASLSIQTLAETAIPPSDATIKLPDLQVTTSADLPPPESWRYTRVGSFEVLSNASDRATKSLLADFGKFTQAMALVWPAPIKPLAASTIILCGKGGKFDAFPPANAKKDDAIIPSVFLRNREQIAIVVDVEADRVAIDPTKVDVINAGSAEYEVDHYKQLYREYVRYLLSQSEARPPIWLEEGLAQIIMDIELDDKTLIYGKINSLKGVASGGESADSDGTDPTANTDAVVGEQPFNAVLQHHKLIPLDQFFAIGADSPEAQNPLGNNLWAKQAYAFVHFCMFGENLRYQQALSTFVSRLAREPLSESLFKECFKVGYADMAKEIRGYILHTKHKYQKYALQKDDKFSAKTIELREATTAEVGLIKGDALRLGGHFDIGYAAYRAAYMRGSRDPALLAGMGVTENALSHPDRARELLEAAIKSGTKLPSAYVDLARLRLDYATAHPAADGKLSVGQMGTVMTLLFEARKYQPPLPETYQLIAAAWAKSSVPPKPDNLGVLDEGVRSFPRESKLLYDTAQLYNQAGSPATAASIAKLGIRFSSDATAKTRFEQLLASLPSTPAAKP
jgi:hypothetical protein